MSLDKIGIGIALVLLSCLPAFATNRVVRQRVVVQKQVVQQVRVPRQRVVVQQVVVPHHVQAVVVPHVQQFNAGHCNNGALQFNAGHSCQQFFK